MNCTCKNHKANYHVIYIGSDEVDDVERLADKAAMALETANGYTFAARTMKDAAVVDPMKLALIMQVGNILQKRGVTR